MRKQLNTFQNNMKKLLAEYLNKSIEEIDDMIKLNAERAINDWNKMGMKKFYEDTDVYLYGLIDYSNWDRLENITFPISKRKNLKILDYGAGIGAISFPLAYNNKMYYYDVPSKTQDFAKYIGERLDLKINFLEENDVWTREYDGIICVDVLEHLKKPMELVKKITSHLKEGQFFLTSGLTFSVGPHTPMHLPENVAYRGAFNKYVDKHYRLTYFIAGPRETIYMFQKKGENNG